MDSGELSQARQWHREFVDLQLCLTYVFLMSYILRVLTVSLELCSENVGLVGLTRVGSRRTVQIAAGFMLFFAIFGMLLRHLIPFDLACGKFLGFFTQWSDTEFGCVVVR